MAITEFDTIFSQNVYSSIPDFDSICQEAGVYKIERTFKILGQTSDRLKNIFTISFDTTYVADSLVSFLIADTSIVYAEEVPIYRTSTIPNDALYSTQWGLDIINAEDAWDLTQGSNKVRVAIVDDAVLLNHEDLKYKIWVNQEEIPDTITDINLDGIIDANELLTSINSNDLSVAISTYSDNLDQDNNGYLDDVLGWDATMGTDNNPNPPSNASSTHFTHGTHVAGIAGHRQPKLEVQEMVLHLLAGIFLLFQ